MFAPELGGLDREQVREWYNGYRVLLLFPALGYDIAVEESSSHGRVDMAVRTAGHVYLFEFKVAEMAPPGSALAQERRYADKYRATGEPIHLIGVEFSRATRKPHRLRGSRRLRPPAIVSAAGRGPAPVRAGSGPGAAPAPPPLLPVAATGRCSRARFGPAPPPSPPAAPIPPATPPPGRNRSPARRRVRLYCPGHGAYEPRTTRTSNPGNRTVRRMVRIVRSVRPWAGAAVVASRPRSWSPVTGRRLPIGMQTFREVREQNCYYVDKTAYIERLLDRGKHYFLSRPRRFGKSLLLDTLKELFEANEPLFTGLHIHDTWDWSVRHPVVRLDFAGGSFNGYRWRGPAPVRAGSGLPACTAPRPAPGSRCPGTAAAASLPGSRGGTS